MKVIGFSAGSVGREGNVDRTVKAILDRSGHEVVICQAHRSELLWMQRLCAVVRKTAGLHVGG